MKTRALHPLGICVLSAIVFFASCSRCSAQENQEFILPVIDCKAPDIPELCDDIEAALSSAFITIQASQAVKSELIEENTINFEVRKQSSIGDPNKPVEYDAIISLVSEQGKCIKASGQDQVRGILRKWGNDSNNLVPIFIQEIPGWYNGCVYPHTKLKLFDYEVRFMYINDNKDENVIPMGTVNNIYHFKATDDKGKPAPILIDMTNFSGTNIKVEVTVEITGAGCESPDGKDTKCAETWHEIRPLEMRQTDKLAIYPDFNQSAYRNESIPARVHVTIKNVGEGIAINEDRQFKLELLPYHEFVWRQVVVDSTTGELKPLPLEDTVKLLISWIDIQSEEMKSFYDNSFKDVLHTQLPAASQDTAIANPNAANPDSEISLSDEKEIVGMFYNRLREKFQAKYNSQTTVFDEYAQKIRLPNQVFIKPDQESQKDIDNAAANCIEWTLFYSSLLLKTSIKPIIIIIPGHAILGWRSSSSPNKIIVLETTEIKDNGFEQALTSGEDKLKKCVVGGQTIFDIMKERSFFTDNSVEVIRRKDYDTKGNTTCKPIFGWDDAVAVFIDVQRVMFDENFDAMGLIKDSEK